MRNSWICGVDGEHLLVVKKQVVGVAGVIRPHNPSRPKEIFYWQLPLAIGQATEFQHLLGRVETIDQAKAATEVAYRQFLKDLKVCKGWGNDHGRRKQCPLCGNLAARISR